MRKVYALLFAVLFFWVAANAQVSVTATAGTTGPTPYTTLSAAFTAINAGTHQGAITIDITANAPDAAVAVLNSSGAGTASYTSVLIRPTADAVTVSFASATGRGVIELNGADNVTIDGDNPNSGGTNRNLTITNTAANTVTFTSAIRLATSTLVTSCNNVTVRNCNLNGSGTGRNTSTFTSEVTTWGIIASGGASTAAATTAPSALGSATTTIASGQTALNFTAVNNAINTVSRGISFNGAALTVSPVLTISNNLIGNSTAGAADQVYAFGITAQGFSAGSVISGNIVYVESFSSTTNFIAGIDVGTVSAQASDGIIEKNVVGRVRNNSTSTFGAVGINLAGTSNLTLRNNFVTNINQDMTGGAAFSTTFGVMGIRIGAGINYKIYHNSVSLSGARTGTPTTSFLSAALTVVSTASTGLDIRNNILSNTLTGGTTSIACVSIYLPTSGTAAMNLTLNSNAYYTGSTAVHGVSHVGTTFTAAPAGPATFAGLYSVAGFNAFATTPNANFRSYTSILSAAGTNDNGSFASTTAAPFVSATDLHIPNGTVTILESNGAAVGVTSDYDGDSRNATSPDIGADEFTGVYVDALPPSITYTPVAPTCTAGDRVVNNVTISDAGGVPTTGPNVPRIYYRKNGGAYFSNAGTLSTGNGNSGTWSFTIVAADMGGLATGDVVGYYIIAQDNAGTPFVSSNPAGAVATGVNTVTTHPAAPNTYAIGTSLTGTYTVGVGGAFTTLTAAATAYNNGCLTGPVVFSLTDAAYPGETFPIVFLQNAFANSTNTLTIRPTGTTTISGASTTAIIHINGGDYITIDGSSAGATATGIGGNAALRNLTVINTSTTATAGAVILVSSGTAGAQNNTLKNIAVQGNDPTQTLLGISVGAGAGAAGSDNDNTRIENCSIQKCFFGIYHTGASPANPNTGTVIARNDLSATGVNRLRRGGIFMFNDNGGQIIENRIGGVVADEAADAIGIIAGIQNITATATTSGGITNILISRNIISGITSTNTTGFSSAAIAIAGDVTGNNVISNNMISGIGAPSTSPDLTAAIFVAGVTGSDTRVYHNTISLSGDRGAVASQIGSYGIGVSGTNPVVDIRNNAIVTTQTSGGGATAKSYALGVATTTFSNLTSNNNSFSSTGANAGGFRSGSLDATGTDYATLAAWRTATTKDANSVDFAPSFVSATDLHLVNTAGANWCLDGAGTTLAAVTIDIDNQSRSNPPDIGADEFSATGLTINNPAAVCQPNTVDITAGAVTSGSIGGLTFTYFTDAAATSTLANPSAVAVSGTYYIKASNGTCTLVRPVVVTVNPVVVVTPTVVQPTTCVATDGSITLALSGAAGPYTYAWTGPGVNATAQNQTGLAVGVYQVTVTPASPGCPVTQSFTLLGPGGCSVCPVIGAFATNPAATVCTGTNVSLTASGLVDMGVTYGITFKYSATPLADPYTGGTVITTVANGALTGGGTQAAATTAFATGGNYNIYAILSPAPADPTCRPFRSSTLTVNAPTTITCPANIIVNAAAGACNAVVTYPAATVTGGFPAPALSYSIPSGSTFNVGVTTVTVTATNACGAPVTCSFTVRVNDAQNPVVTCPAAMNFTTTAGQCTRVVTYTPTATDNCTGVTVTANPASGFAFPIGNTTVNVTATDGAGNTATCSFVVSIADAQPPSITAANQPKNDTVCVGETASFTVVATNGVGYQWQVNSGSGFTNIPGATTATLTVPNVTVGMNNYQYHVIVSGLCPTSTVTSANVLLKVNANPTVSILASPLTTLQPNQVTTLYATFTGTPGSFNWLVNGQLLQTTTAPLLPNTTVDHLGNYSVVFRDINGCTATSNVVPITANQNFEFWVYPVPNDGRFLVRFYSFTLGVKRTLRVWDAKGSIVFEKEFTMNSNYERMDVDISKNTAGTYYVELRDASGPLGTGKVLVLK